MGFVLYKATPAVDGHVCSVFCDPHLRKAVMSTSCTFDPLSAFIAHYADSSIAPREQVDRAVLSVEERLKARIVDGDSVGLDADLEEARTRHAPLDIINDILLDGMKTVGELFGAGQMQLPFVLQSAETMKRAVAFLEPFMEKMEGMQKGTIVLATVKGDVHDIGKNLVDIILTNNGYRVINLGIKVPIETMISAVREHHADALGMSGLLVKSTVVMKENLEIIRERGLRIPVILGGAALTRRYVEQDLRAVYPHDLAYAGDAFDGLSFMERLAAQRRDGPFASEAASPSFPVEPDELSGMEAKLADSLAEQGEENLGAALESAIVLQRTQEERASPVGTIERNTEARPAFTRRSAVSSSAPIPRPPFFGSRLVTDIDLDHIYPFINEAALIRGQWQVKKGSLSDAEYRALLDREIHPTLAKLKRDAVVQGWLRPALVYGHFPCASDGNDLVIFKPKGLDGDALLNEWPAFGEALDELEEWKRFSFPRQNGDRYLCIADFVRPLYEGIPDVCAFQAVTMGREASMHSANLFARHAYQEYLYFHGLSVETAEALAEYWHKMIRTEWGIADRDASDIKRLFSQGYQGSRYSFGYPACPRLEDQVPLFDLLRPERIGISLSEEFQLDPEQSTTAIVVHHPEAKYFLIK